MDDSVLKDKFNILGKSINSLQEVLEHPEINTNIFIRDSAIKRFITSNLSLKNNLNI
jgi:hypothetical protein